MAFQDSDIDISLYFDLDNTRFRIKDNSDYAGASPAISTADVVGVYKITDPNSNILHENADFDNEDIDIDVSLYSPYVTFTVTDGVYTVIYSVYDSDTDTTYSKTFTFTYAASNTPDVVIDIESNVGLAIISSTDETAFTATKVLNTRTHTLTYPADWGSTTITSLDVDSISLEILYTGEYSTTITSTITITQTDDLIIDTTITGTETHDVWDTDGFYTIREALNNYYDSWQTNKTADPKEYRRQERIWTEICANYTMYNSYKQNGDIENAGEFLNNIKVILAAEDIDTDVDPSTSVPVTSVIPGHATAWTDGDGVPSPTLGVTGDYYYRKDTGHVYNKISGTWTDIGLIYSNTTVDGVTLEIVDGDIQIKDDGVTGAKLAPAVAGDGLKQNGSGNLNIEPNDFAGDGLSDDGSDNLKVNVDDSTIETNSDTLRIKDDGVTGAKLNVNVIDDSTLEQTGTTLNIKNSGVTGAKLNANTYDDISINKNGSNKLYSIQNTYVAYADDATGVGFTETFSTDRNYIAVLYTDTPIETLSASDFDGLWFRIAKFGDSFTYENIDYYDTHEKGLGWTANFLVNSMSPTAYYFEDTYRRVYFVYFEGRLDTKGDARGGGREARTWLSYYDIDTKMFAEEVTFTEQFPDSDDLHNMPTVIVADSGHIIVIKESLKPSGGHNSAMEIWRSNSSEDISAFTKVTELDYELAYPQIFKITDGTIFLYCRERIGGEERYNAIFKSEDDGANWTSLEDVSDTKTQVVNYDTAGYFAYPRSMMSSRAQGINIILNPDIGVSGNYESISFMHSDDGITWENARQFVEGSGGYSHNILTEGVLDRSDIDTNYLVDGPIGNPTDYYLLCQNGCLTPDGIPYIVSVYYEAANTALNRLSNLYLYYYDSITHAWIKKDILSLLVRSNASFGDVTNIYPIIIAYGNSRIDVIVAMSKDIADLITPDVVINSGTLTAGVTYRILTTTGSLKTGVGVNGIFKSNGTETPDGSNTVVVTRTTYYVFRSDDNGDSFTYYDLDSKYNGIGGYGAMMINFNCIEKKQLFLGCQTSETTDYTDKLYVEYSNIQLFHSKID